MPTVWETVWQIVAILAALTAAGSFGYLVWTRAHAVLLAPPTSHRPSSPAEALAQLQRGAGQLSTEKRLSREGRAKLADLAKQQQPFAVLVGCSDSRVAPELIFGCGLGDLFVVRNAGNTVGDRALGSIIYGVTVLGAPLIVVLGHARCGAVEAATQLIDNDEAFSGALKQAIVPILPAVEKARRANPPDLIAAAVHENVRAVVERLRTSSEPEIVGRVADGRLRVVGAYYDLVTGEVEF